MNEPPMKILCALSGGVDSSVATYLLKKMGHFVEAVYVRTWENEDDPLGDCPGAKDLADARGVCDLLKIPFRVVNFIDFYQQQVVQPMIEGYASGITPNPDILCNRRMKFGALMKYALKNEFEALATGHYCQRHMGNDGNAQLWEGKDKNKDQSYFLAQVTQEQLNFARFPLGNLHKTEVRNIAKELQLPVADKKDSQGICFLGKVKVPEFLANFIDNQPGEIVTTEGKVVGKHLGLHRYTLGQRKGIGVPSNTDNENFVVTGKDQSKNQLIVAFDKPEEKTLWGTCFVIESVTFFEGQNPIKKIELLGKARYRDPSTKLSFEPLDNNRAQIQFQKPQRALTPGQVLALYKGDRLIGSGTYAHSELGRAKLSA